MNQITRIFETLEQGAPEYDQVFDRVYGTPHNRDLVTIARGFGARAHEVNETSALTTALRSARTQGGINVIVVNLRG